MTGGMIELNDAVANVSSTLSTGEAVMAIQWILVWAGSVVILMTTIIGIIAAIMAIVGTWKMFEKANLPGWGTLIPFYNIYLFIKLAGRPGRWFLLLLVPFVNIVIGLILNFDIAKRFGKGFGYGLGVLFLYPIFAMILGFGDAKYHPVEEISEVIEA